ncbi:MAG: 3D-(3,5/4)-trihydroxycyclohexane-1,2-dione acylhydrolase (decyclizing) [Clostridiaceae bacterium]|jgi:3D-(3,5/4)-trihydroxycyclohexane-1,2-dione acylhydrolase (decyclizing)|nr:3D-(3,5/4)-trihydroxycyclohexane-1,2-dione acylhydrolase (decyclizing) [Clostridiaceae bacterium]
MTETKRISTGEALITFLDNQYVSFDGVETKLVEYVYALFGHGCVLGSGEALSMTRHGLTVLQGKNEQGMAHAATAYAKQKNRRAIIPCFSSIGPGAANMVTAAGTATANNIPLLLFPGDTFATRQPDPVLQQVEHEGSQSITTNDAFRAVVKYFDRVSRPEMLMSALLNAIRVLLDPAQTGAVAIAMPQDVQGEVYDFPLKFLSKRVHRIKRLVPSQEELDDAVKIIKKAKRPLIIVGGGARYSEAGKVIEKFAAKCGIPIAETQAGKSAVSSDYRLNLGGVGVTGNAAANAIAATADVIIGIGTKFSDFTTASKSLFSRAKVVTVNTGNRDASKLDAVKIVADAKITVEMLEKIIRAYRVGEAYEAETAAAKADWEKEYARLASLEFGAGYVPENVERAEDTIDEFIKSSGSALTQTRALDIIRKGIAENAVAVGASGSLPGCMQRMWETRARDSYNMEYGYSCMGYEIAGAFGSKLAEPDREVYAFVGDGSYLMLHSEMVTAVQEGVKIGILLFDNGGFGCINNLQMGQGITPLATEFRFRDGDKPIRYGAYVPIDFAMSARAYGFDAYTAKNSEELETALKAARASDKPFLIDIKVLPKSMTSGYGGWWNVGCTENPRNEKQKAALAEKKAKLAKAGKY